MRSQSWPPLIRPMLAVAGDLPHDRGWVYEFKWDGVRAPIPMGLAGCG